MKGSRLKNSQIASNLQEADADARVKEIRRRHRISDATDYTSKSKPD